MEKKVAIITGASSGVGLETAFELLNLGFTVYGGARRVDRMQQLQEKGGQILALDVTNEESMQQFVNTVFEKEKRIDILINNAGYGSCGAIEEVPLEEVRNQFEVNVFGLGRMIQLVLPIMRSQNAGKIVNISSMGGLFTSPFCGWYHSTKYAVESISDALRVETEPFNIDVILIEPGMIQTNWGVIAARHIEKYSGQGAYKKRAKQAERYYESNYADEAAGLTEPGAVAKVITRAATVKKPKARYLIGKYARLSVTAKKLLSTNMFQKMMTTMMGLDK